MNDILIFLNMLFRHLIKKLDKTGSHEWKLARHLIRIPCIKNKIGIPIEGRNTKVLVKKGRFSKGSRA